MTQVDDVRVGAEIILWPGTGIPTWTKEINGWRSEKCSGRGVEEGRRDSQDLEVKAVFGGDLCPFLRLYLDLRKEGAGSMWCEKMR